MKIYAVCDDADTQAGLRLAGIGGTVVEGRPALKTCLERVLADKDIGVLLITQALCAASPELIHDIRLNRALPLVTEIPGRG